MNQTVYHPTKEYFHNRDARLALNAKDKKLWNASGAFLKEIVRTNYSSNFSWLGRPIIQIPQDMFALQEIIWSMKPDFIVETGIAHGGSIIFYASMLELIGKGTVIGIDIDIRKPNREEIEKHSLFRRIEMIEGSSISSEVVEKVKAKIGDAKKVLVCLDSNHTHEHVLKELELYTPFITGLK
jgi:cephalosporin hydroxylase